MREIIFRGRDVFTNQWRYGDLAHNQKVTRTGLEPRTMVNGYEVMPNTVGQWTGAMDCDGRNVFEGDIICITYNGKVIFNATVVWLQRLNGFYMDEEDNKQYSPLPSKEYIKVIGNIYANGTE